MQEPEIHVGIMNTPTLHFRLNAPYRIMNENTVIEAGSYEANFSDGSVQFRNRKYPELVLVPVRPEESSFDLCQVTIGVNFHWERQEDQRFQGNLKLVADEKELVVINVIPLEKYLVSVISSEMSATASLPLLEAHAVISRSWLMAQLEKQEKSTAENRGDMKNTADERICWYDREDHRLFHVCADDHCQRYQGITRASTPAVEEAVRHTHGEILTWEGEICDARFSKCCGGVSEEFENCWDNHHYPYLTPVYDLPEPGKNIPDLTQEKNAQLFIRTSPPAFCHTSDPAVLNQVLNNYDQETTDFYRWKITYTQEELSRLIRERSGIDFGDIIDLIPLERGASGRIVRLEIIGTRKTLIVGKELEIRRILSPSHLYSSAFVTDKGKTVNGVPESFTLTGAGWGHGVGLCQIGAAVMGSQGYDYKQILSHYFRGAKLTRMY